jgi:hypothetical protein
VILIWTFLVPCLLPPFEINFLTLQWEGGDSGHGRNEAALFSVGSVLTSITFKSVPRIGPRLSRH